MAIRIASSRYAPFALLLLHACGGGGGDGGAACGEQGFGFTTTWTGTGGSYNPSPFMDQIVVGKVAVPLSAKPVHDGVPQACVSKGTYMLGNPTFPLPAGLTLNAATGEIAGTPTAPADVTGGGTDTGMVRFSFPGYGSTRVLARLKIDP